MVKKLGIYIHLPFCVSKCAYCDFYSVTEGEDLMDGYQKALLAHIKTMSTPATGYQVDSIYFGGGTPTLYGAKRVEALLRALKKAFRVERDAEITLEGNPESLRAKGVLALTRAGVNRFSLGMQSASDQELKAIGRPHSPQDTREAVGILKDCGVKNISLDLIYGLPGQSITSWAHSLEEAIALEPQHLSCYGLKVEEGTPLAQRVAEGERLPDEDSQAELYLWTVERLRHAGYGQYEISNFAQRGLSSRHNLGYWTGKPYLGFGASAASDFGGYRYTLQPDIQEYCRCVLQGGQQIFTSNQLMSQGERREEYLMLRLRTTQGISQEGYEKACQLSFSPIAQVLKSFAQEGWAQESGGQWRLTPEGFLRSNQLIALVLEAQETSGAPQPPPWKGPSAFSSSPPPVAPLQSEPPEEGEAWNFLEDDNGQLHF